jgi:ribose transport system substrate-binding protein
VEQAGRPASEGFQSELRFAYRIRRHSSGKQIAEILFKTIGGSGGIIALGGQISNTAAIERKKGLDQALAANSNIKLLDFQVANWKSTEAFDLTGNLLTRFGDDIKGIWAANDDMGTGALEALRAENLAGKVPVVGIDGIKTAVDAVRPANLPAPSPPIPSGRAAWVLRSASTL